MYILDFERIIVEAIKLLTMFRFENSDAFYLLVLIPMVAGLWYLGNNIVKKCPKKIFLDSDVCMLSKSKRFG